MCALWGGTFKVLLLLNLSSCKFFFIFFSCMLFLGRFKLETCDIKGGGRLHLCEKVIEWDMEGHLHFFL